MYLVKYMTFDYNGEFLAVREFDSESKALIFASAVNGIVERV